MKAAERQLRIRQMFETRDFLDLETLCRELDASESSVRRDLDILEEEKLLRRVYGGAVPLQQPPARAFDYAVESGRLSDEKDHIASFAAGLIEDGLIEKPIQVDLVPLPGLEDGEVPGLEGLGVEMEMGHGKRAFLAIPAVGQQDSAYIEEDYVEGEHRRLWLAHERDFLRVR